MNEIINKDRKINMLKYIKQEELKGFIDAIDNCLEEGYFFDFKEKYLTLYVQAMSILIMAQGKLIPGYWFSLVNDWLGAFACQIEEYSLEEENPELYLQLLNISEKCTEKMYDGKIYAAAYDIYKLGS